MPTLRYNDGIGRLNLLTARSLFPLTSREISNRFCIVIASLFLLPPPARLMRERKLERIALVVRIHDGRELVGEVLVEIFEISTRSLLASVLHAASSNALPISITQTNLRADRLERIV